MQFKMSALEEREKYYSEEFDMEKVKSWFRKNRIDFPQLLALDCGTETGIIRFPEKRNKIISIKASDIRKKAIHYLPEDLYYDRNRYKDPDRMLKTLRFKDAWKDKAIFGQELAFDIDPENIECACRNKYPGFCPECSKEAIRQSILFAEKLEENYSRINLAYSGRGMHIHVFDKDAFLLTPEEREKINRRFEEFPIDPWVSRGYIRLIRLPYSLNALVSRIVTPMTISEASRFDPQGSEKAVPKFLHSGSSSSSGSSPASSSFL
jgi:DNA primase catalytic subunit